MERPRTKLKLKTKEPMDLVGYISVADQIGGA